MISRILKSEDWTTDLNVLKKLLGDADNNSVLEEFVSIKRQKKIQLATYIQKHEGIAIDPDSIFDSQIKRLHEYKRQLLNILAILWLAFELEDGKISDFKKTTFIFGAKSAPGYKRAKGIIKLINEAANYISSLPNASQKIKVVFVSNYNVSYAEKIVAATDVSEQISTVGTEASGTGNMKFMLNGAVTLGTLDGANVEIVREAGIENNYIFGAKVDELEKIREEYEPSEILKNAPKLKRVIEALVDGTLDDGGTGAFKDIYDSLIKGCEWQSADNYLLLYDFADYVRAKLEINRDYGSREFKRKCFVNMCCAGFFSSDRTIAEYANSIWHINPVA